MPTVDWITQAGAFGLLVVIVIFFFKSILPAMRQDHENDLKAFREEIAAEREHGLTILREERELHQAEQDRMREVVERNTEAVAGLKDAVQAWSCRESHLQDRLTRT